MIRLLVAGVWVCVVTLLSSYVAANWKPQRAAAAPAPDKVEADVEPLKLRMLSVPVIHEGEHQGYVMVQFAVTADAGLAKHHARDFEMLVADAAFRSIYGQEDVDFRKLRKQDLTKITTAIVESVNRKAGKHLVNDVFVQELNYVPKSEVRVARPK
jgi:hypothetical protein